MTINYFSSVLKYTALYLYLLLRHIAILTIVFDLVRGSNCSHGFFLMLKSKHSPLFYQLNMERRDAAYLVVKSNNRYIFLLLF